jgi:cell division protein FtsL
MGVWRNGRRLVVITLWLAILVSALAVVFARHENRRLFIELQALQAERDELDNEWSKLRIEQSFWSGYARVEDEARTRLGMYTPVPEQVVIVEP